MTDYSQFGIDKSQFEVVKFKLLKSDIYKIEKVLIYMNECMNDLEFEFPLDST